MTKRELTKEERELSEKQLNKHKENLKELEMNMKYNKSLIKMQQDKRTHDELFRPYLLAKKDKEDEEVLNIIKKEIENSEEHIKILTDQLKNGVEIKKIVGIN